MRSVFFYIVCFLISNIVFSQKTNSFIKEHIENSKNIIFIEDALNADENRKVLQGFLNNMDVIILPNRSIRINDKGLMLKSNQIIIFQEKSEIVLQPSEKEAYAIFKVHNVSNVTIYNPRLIGDKNVHLGNKGQWGVGISIKNSEYVTITGGKVEAMWGDGIYIGQLNNSYSSNVIVENVLIENCRRNGISITSGKDVLIKNCIIKNTSGHSPESGIDIEPNSTNDIISNISLIDNSTYNNKFAGVLIVLDKLKGNEVKKVGVKISNHFNKDSKYGVALHGFLESQSNNMKGIVKIRDFKNFNVQKEYHLYKLTYMSKLIFDWK